MKYSFSKTTLLDTVNELFTQALKSRTFFKHALQQKMKVYCWFCIPLSILSFI